MGAKKKVTTVTTTQQESDAPIDASLDTPGAKPDSPADPLNELIEFAGPQQARYQLVRVTPKPGKCGTYEQGELSEQRIRADWGHGTYTVTAVNGSGQYIRRVQVVLAEALQAPVVVAPAAPSNDMALFMQVMQNQNTMMMEILKATIAKPAPAAAPAVDPMQQHKMLLETMVAMKDLSKPDKAPDAMETFLRGVEFAKGLGDGDGLSWPAVAAGAVKELRPLAEQLVNSLPARAPASAAPPQPQTPLTVQATVTPQIPASAAAQPPLQENDMLQHIAWLKGQCLQLVRLAQARKDPNLYAEVFLDNLKPGITFAMIEEQFKDPANIQKLALLVPDVEKHVEWFDAFRKEVLEYIGAQRDKDDDEEEERNKQQAAEAGAPVIEEIP
jgi:hypothetical protein